MIFYRIYQICIMLPLLLVATVLCGFVTVAGCALGGGKWWGFKPASLWGRLWCVLAGVRVQVRGRDNINPGTSYVFVANHQGAYDIFSIYGYLHHDFRWMMKQSLRRIPVVGFSCAVSGQVFVDNSSPSAIRRTMQAAEKQLAKGRSVVVFPEGSRTSDGRMHAFKRGAYTLAVEFGLPVVPITIDSMAAASRTHRAHHPPAHRSRHRRPRPAPPHGRLPRRHRLRTSRKSALKRT